MDSVEELEAAIDAMQGIAEDGGEAEPDSLAREARIRSAYLDWCKEQGKEADEARFKVFEYNFLSMEEYAKESGKEMTLNKYADCTEEEYFALTGGTRTSEKPAEAKVETKKAKEEGKDSRPRFDGLCLLGPFLTNRSSFSAKMSAAELAAESEKERKARRAAQEKALEEMEKANEAVAIAAVSNFYTLTVQQWFFIMDAS
jgi:hypothetical protein